MSDAQPWERDSADFSLSHVEGLNLSYVKAPLLKRALAFAVDFAIFSTFFYLFIIVVGLITGVGVLGLSQAMDKIWGSDIGRSLLFLIGTLFVLTIMCAYHYYFIYFETKKGTTPGKKLFGLSVISLEGKPIDFKTALKRELYRYIDVWFFGAGALIIYLSKNSQRLGDMFTNTAVVYSRRSEEARNYVYISQEDYEYYLENLNPNLKVKQIPIRFLQDAHQAFVNKKQMRASVMKEWAEIFRERIEIDQDVEIDDKSLLLFFAEHCLKMKNESEQI